MISVIWISVFCFAFQKATSLKSEGKIPLEPWTLGRTIYAHVDCGPCANKSKAILEVAPYGVILKDMFPWPDKFDGCPEEIVVIFSKSDAKAHLMYRPNVKPSYFADTHADLYKRFMEDPNTGFLPCSKVPVEKIEVWGKRFETFKKLIRKGVKMAEYIRDYNCDHYAQPPNTIIMRDPQDVKTMLERHRLANAVINYLHTVAYNNFFCI